MTSRRGFLAAVGAAVTYPMSSWADVGSPAFISAAKRRDGQFVLVGLSARGASLFEIALPGRGHAGAVHPSLPYAVAFARRPGTFALVIDCVRGKVARKLVAPMGRHFYGHGVFSADGHMLFTTENDYENAEGKIGVWDMRTGCRRVDEFSSGGVGPHDISLMPDGQTLVVANGGIETHPDSDRIKLNIPTMLPNLSYLSTEGVSLEQTRLPQNLHKASIRHLSVRADGMVAIGCQWQGAEARRPLLFQHKLGGALTKLHITQANSDLQGYVGSVTFTKDGRTLFATSPRGNVAVLYNLNTQRTHRLHQADVCGAAAGSEGVVLTAGNGVFVLVTADGIQASIKTDYQWDNHLVAL
ncbi:MAG: DUF1513 domain-containing protein [Cognatishimia sp.]